MSDQIRHVIISKLWSMLRGNQTSCIAGCSTISRDPEKKPQAFNNLRLSGATRGEGGGYQIKPVISIISICKTMFWRAKETLTVTAKSSSSCRSRLKGGLMRLMGKIDPRFSFRG
jgi:hypothetical protein